MAPLCSGVDQGFGAVWPYLHCLSLGLIATVLRSQFTFRTKLILTGQLVAPEVAWVGSPLRGDLARSARSADPALDWPC